MRSTVAVGLLLVSFFAVSQKACEKNLEVARAYEEVGQYALAVDYYQRSFSRCKEDERLFDISRNLLALHEFDELESILKKYIEKPGALAEGYKLLAESLRYSGKYEEAIGNYKNYFNQVGIKIPIDDDFVPSCDSALKWSKEAAKVTIVTLPQLNSFYREACPSYYGDGIVFSSTREGVLIKKKDEQLSEPYFNLFYAEKKGNGKWKDPVTFSADLNSTDHDVGVEFSDDNQTIYLTRSIHKDYNKSDEANTNHLKLYKAEKTSFGWSKPEYFVLNDSSFSFGHPTIAHDGEFFLFASDMSGGFGGVDLYVTFKSGGGWSKPKNLGGEINTKGDEMYPYLLDDGKLFFSSNGHIGMGGFDIYSAVLSGGGWGEVTNMRSPINSSYDDFSFIQEQNKKTGFLTSNRKGGKGNEDIYQVIFH